MMAVIHILIMLLMLFGVVVITYSRNIVHAAYALALVLIGVAGMYILLSAELLAVVQILIYAGGVVILLSFGIMMTNRMGMGKVISESRNELIGVIVAILLFLGLSVVINQLHLPTAKVEQPSKAIEQIGIAFLTDHIVAFELIAFILLVALVGAAYLAKMSSDE